MGPCPDCHHHILDPVDHHRSMDLRICLLGQHHAINPVDPYLNMDQPHSVRHWPDPRHGITPRRQLCCHQAVDYPHHGMDLDPHHHKIHPCHNTGQGSMDPLGQELSGLRHMMIMYHMAIPCHQLGLHYSVTCSLGLSSMGMNHRHHL